MAEVAHICGYRQDPARHDPSLSASEAHDSLTSCFGVETTMLRLTTTRLATPLNAANPQPETRPGAGRF